MWAGGGGAPVRALSSAVGGAMHPAGLLPPSPRPGGVCPMVPSSHSSPAPRLPQGLSSGWILPRVLLHFPISCFSLPHCCRSRQVLTLERRCHRRWLPKTTRSSTSTLCTMQARRRPDGSHLPGDIAVSPALTVPLITSGRI